jgi:hypothetical protein
MKPGFRPLQFGMRTMLLVITLVGVYLAWRIHNPERAAVRAIRAAGGKVHFGYQQPSAADTFISIGMLPQNEHFSQVDVRVSGSTEPPPLTASEVFFRPGSEHRVRMVEIELDQISELQFVVVEMPAGVLKASSPEVKKLDTLRWQLPVKIYPSFRPTRW